MHKKYFKMTEMDGEVELQGLEGTVELLGFHWGVALEGRHFGSGSSFSRVCCLDLTIKKLVDRTSPILARACAEGGCFKDAVVFVTKPVNDRLETYYRIRLSGVLVKRVETLPPLRDGMAEVDAAPRELVSLGYDEIRWDYAAFDSAGRRQAWITKGWSLKNAMTI